MAKVQSLDEKKKRGGARPGSGRPKKGDKTYTFIAVPEAEAILAALPNGTKSDYINRAIIFYAKSRD